MGPSPTALCYSGGLYPDRCMPFRIACDLLDDSNLLQDSKPSNVPISRCTWDLTSLLHVHASSPKHTHRMQLRNAIDKPAYGSKDDTTTVKLGDHLACCRIYVCCCALLAVGYHLSTASVRKPLAVKGLGAACGSGAAHIHATAASARWTGHPAANASSHTLPSGELASIIDGGDCRPENKC